MAQNDNNNKLEDSCSRLEKIANEARIKLITQNIYQDEESKRYDARHPNATQKQGGYDDRRNNKGKGTGKYLDTSNGGGYTDINGRSDVGGGRIATLQKNKYTPDKPYNCFIF